MTANSGYGHYRASCVGHGGWDTFWRFQFHTVSHSRLRSDVLRWKPHARNLCAAVHEVEDGDELSLSSSVRVRMAEVLDRWSRVHPGQPTTIYAAGNRGPTHVSRSLFHPYLTVLFRSEQSDCTCAAIANGINC